MKENQEKLPPTVKYKIIFSSKYIWLQYCKVKKEKKIIRCLIFVDVIHMKSITKSVECGGKGTHLVATFLHFKWVVQQKEM